MGLRLVVLALAWFAGVNAAVSLMSWGAAVFALSSDRVPGPRWLLLVRLAPAATSVLFVGAFFVPSFWLLEARDASETLGVTWVGLATAGVWLWWRAGARMVRLAVAGSRPRLRVSRLVADGVHEVEGLPGVSLAGVIRPRILVGPAVVRELSPAELEVAVAHEVAHRDAFDNLARWGMYCAPDFLSGAAVTRRLERAWHEAAETRADHTAAAGDRQRALHLAAALVKVARLAPGVQPIPQPGWSTLHDAALLESRVRGLIAGEIASAPPARGRSLAMILAFLIGVSAPLAADTVHRLTETLIARLP